jgi:2-dehydro-3-deoxyglucarate aldolase/4-hydroxy-2-oxoheptanedioate aldolase
LRYRLDKGDRLGVAWLSLGSVAMAELAARAKPDAIVLDLQHGLWDRASMEHAIGVIPPSVPVLVRVAENTPLAIGQALDAGAEGVIVPLVETAEQARAAVRSAHFPPYGERSGGGVRPLAGFLDYVEAARRAIVVCVMIETERGVRHARAIAATEGVDLVFIGTGDLALSLGTFPAFDARHEAACQQVMAACRAEWTLCGTFTGSLEAARARREQGYRMVVTVNDIELVAKGVAQATELYAQRPPPAPAAIAPAAPVRLPAAVVTAKRKPGRAKGKRRS